MTLKKKPECETCELAYQINHDVYQPMYRVMGLIDVILIEYDKGNFEVMAKLRKMIDPENEELKKRVNNLYSIK